MTEKINQPLAEVFGFPIKNFSAQADRYRKNKLCPFNNKVPSCTKDKANSPLGVCSVFHNKNAVITCPVRFREDWLIAGHAAKFLFSRATSWTSLSEIRLNDKEGNTAGNIDLVLVSYDKKGKILDFGSVEIQAVYISGNVRDPFEYYLKNAHKNSELNWKSGYNYPKPDYLSSSRKRLVPQMLYKGGIFKNWGKKQVVALQKSFFYTLPSIPKVDKSKADIAWLLYDLVFARDGSVYKLELVETVYSEFGPALDKIIKPEAGDISDFIGLLQEKLDEKLEGNAPDAPTLIDVINS